MKKEFDSIAISSLIEEKVHLRACKKQLILFYQNTELVRASVIIRTSTEFKHELLIYI